MGLVLSSVNNGSYCETDIRDFDGTTDASMTATIKGKSAGCYEEKVIEP